VISCLRRAGVDVAERRVPVWDGREQKWSAGLTAALRLGAAEARLLARLREPFDVLIVGYPGHLDLAAARHAAGSRPVVFNPLISLSDTLVGDRRRFRPGGIAERALRAIDRQALRAADLVVSDTDANAELFRSLGAGRVETCFVGAEERIFRPGWEGGDTAVFVGKLIPLHGLETILAAARLAPDLRFRIVGSGQLDRLLDGRPANVEHVPWVEYERLPGQLRHASCALGVFGTSAKAARVIPNKVFQALACGTPVVTADTPAARELLRDGESALLVPPGDPEALVTAIRRVTPELGAGGLAAYCERAGEQVLGERWRGLIESLL
jgi:glycosyltransferase involved in cell wall biosynthesis